MHSAPRGKPPAPIEPPKDSHRSALFRDDHGNQRTPASKLEHQQLVQAKYQKAKPKVGDTRNILCKQPFYREFTTSAAAQFPKYDKVARRKGIDPLRVVSSSFSISQNYEGKIEPSTAAQFKPYKNPKRRALAHDRDERFQSNLNKIIAMDTVEDQYTTTTKRDFIPRKGRPAKRCDPVSGSRNLIS